MNRIGSTVAKRDADHGPAEDVGALEQTPTPNIDGHVDMLV
jgi:hypothetical protein